MLSSPWEAGLVVSLGWLYSIMLTERGKPPFSHTHSLPASISWRDMWAFVTVKGGAVIGEDVGKSVDVNTWGPPVNLQVTIPLADSGKSM